MERYENTYLGLLDVGFTRFVTEGVLKFLYVLTVVLAAIGLILLIVGVFINVGVGEGTGALIMAPFIFFFIAVFIRVLFEIFIVLFRIADYLKEIAENTSRTAAE